MKPDQRILRPRLGPCHMVPIIMRAPKIKNCCVWGPVGFHMKQSLSSSRPRPSGHPVSEAPRCAYSTGSERRAHLNYSKLYSTYCILRPSAELSIEASGRLIYSLNRSNSNRRLLALTYSIVCEGDASESLCDTKALAYK